MYTCGGMKLCYVALGWACALSACTADVEITAMHDGEEPASVGQIAYVNKNPRYTAIRSAASARGMRNAYLLAGIANDETGLAMCWSEAQWACPGPASPDCGGGAIIGGSYYAASPDTLIIENSQFSQNQATWLFYLSVLLMPELLVVIGIAVWSRRRNG